jgi:hypothetical protein
VFPLFLWLFERQDIQKQRELRVFLGGFSSSFFVKWNYITFLDIDSPRFFFFLFLLRKKKGRKGLGEDVGS